MDFRKTQEPSEVLVNRPDWHWIAGLLVAGALLGSLATGAYFGWKLKRAQNNCATQINEAKKTSAESSAISAPKISVPDEVFNISGTVEKIDGDFVTVKAFFFGEPKNYAVKITDDTKIIKREMLENPPEPEDGNPLSPFKDSDAKLSDIREKDNVSIDSSENIKDKTEFEAKIIYIQISNVPVPVPPPSASNNVPAPAATGSSDIPPAPTTVPPVPTDIPPAPSSTIVAPTDIPPAPPIPTPVK